MRLDANKLRRFIAAARQGFGSARRQQAARIAIFRRAFVAARKTGGA
ncbi:hypothetical protein [Brevundimonas sp.]|nr:hypothetical protein [Brevundimonas sp.]HYC98485.1 hypothetical protein [Brevundimonas sp.]